MYKQLSVQAAGALTAVLVLLMAAGCGGSNSGNEDSSTTIAASALGRTQFVKKANAICERGRDEAVARAGTTTIVVAIQKGILPSFQTAANQVRALGAPKGDRAELEAFDAALQSAINAAKKSRPTALSTFEGLFRQSGKMARAYGITACAYG